MGARLGGSWSKKVDFDSNAIDELLFASWAKALEAPMKTWSLEFKGVLLGLKIGLTPLGI